MSFSGRILYLFTTTVHVQYLRSIHTEQKPKRFIHTMHWRIHLVGGARNAPPPGRSNFFHFHAFFSKKKCCQIESNRFLQETQGWRPLPTRLGNPGSATAMTHIFEAKSVSLFLSVWKDPYTSTEWPGNNGICRVQVGFWLWRHNVTSFHVVTLTSLRNVWQFCF